MNKGIIPISKKVHVFLDTLYMCMYLKLVTCTTGGYLDNLFEQSKGRR